MGFISTLFHNNINSKQITLNKLTFISEIPVEIIRPPQDIYEAPGADVIFMAELNKDGVEVKWLRNNMIIIQGDKHQMMSEGKIHRLQVCDIKPRDQGEYRFIAKDKEARAKLELAGKLFVWCSFYKILDL